MKAKEITDFFVLTKTNRRSLYNSLTVKNHETSNQKASMISNLFSHYKQLSRST